MFKKSKRSISQSGFTLVELLLVFAVAAAILGGLFYAYTKVKADREVQDFSNDSLIIKTNVLKLFMNQNGFGSANVNANLIAVSGFPSSHTTTPPSTVTNEWGGATIVTGAGTTFTVSEALVPQDLCTAIIPRLAGGRWSSVSVNGTTTATTVAASATACNQPNNTILMTN